MKEQYIWPLAGVFLGWLLTTISTTYKARTHKKGLVGNLLAKLIRVERQIEIILASTEYIKDLSGSWEKYEPIRKGVADRNLMAPESVKNDLKSAIDAIAPVYPLLAIELEDIFHILLKNKSANLSDISKTNNNAYIKALSLYEAGLELNKQALSKIIGSLALRHNIITYFKIKICAFKRNNNLKNPPSIFQSIIEEINENIK